MNGFIDIYGLDGSFSLSGYGTVRQGVDGSVKEKDIDDTPY